MESLGSGPFETSQLLGEMINGTGKGVVVAVFVSVTVLVSVIVERNTAGGFAGVEGIASLEGAFTEHAVSISSMISAKFREMINHFLSIIICVLFLGQRRRFL